ncbi:DivIVA domain-containing protein [Paractinoplanes rhizophilus]|uniref:DivIVA domain-containing protein n=1 Tax=Paractinoplanes rhizophilus TaxID=1416877 RepID=A0ABW2HS09_9ACTN|nr:DivIVA domain-containing protein [Actinoplanes sp.]
MTSQGQRFRRRALRRGYKVDEVDSFLDRVEATLAGEQVGPPVGAQEVHDVVFRVRFGGYDEWQVDLHLDRVERQLAELEDRGGRPIDPMRDSMRGGLSTGDIRGNSGGGNTGDIRGGMAGRGAGMTGGGAVAGMGAAGMGGMGGAGGGMGNGGMAGRMAPPTERLPAPIREDRMQPQQMPQRQQMPPSDPYGRYEEPPPPYGGQQPQLPQRPGPPPGYDTSGYDTGGYDTGGFDGFEAGRHGKTDMTAEIRMPQRDADPRGGYGDPDPRSGYGGPPSMSGAPMSGPPVGGGYGGPQLPPPMGEPGGELYRVDQLRRTFQVRRFGSGYDPMQVDRLFEGILQAMTGRGPMPVPENELDMLQFGLVSGGYFEAEVDAALREVKDILLRRR